MRVINGRDRVSAVLHQLTSNLITGDRAKRGRQLFDLLKGLVALGTWVLEYRRIVIVFIRTYLRAGGLSSAGFFSGVRGLRLSTAVTIEQMHTHSTALQDLRLKTSSLLI